jgi:hypothetical protein
MGAAMDELRWLGIGCAVLAWIIAFGVGLYAVFGEHAGAAVFLTLLFIGGGAMLGDVLRGTFGQR